jgi:hypothetical protein
MLHSLPALLEELEQKIMLGQDPLPLINGIRWQEVIDWPRTLEEAGRLRKKLDGLKFLINGLQAPLRATLMRLNPGATYMAKGGVRLPGTISFRVANNV